MMIINEELVGKELDKNGITTNQHPIKLARVLVKYYKHIGKTNTEIDQLLQQKIKIKNDTDGLIGNYVHSVVSHTMNKHGKFRDGLIPISVNELEYIHQLDNIELEKFMFTFLVLYKSFGHPPRIKKDTFLRMALMKSYTGYFDDCYYELYQRGYIVCKENKRKEQDKTIYELVYEFGKDFPQFDEQQIAFTIHDTNTPVLFYYLYYNICNVEFCEECGEPYIHMRKQKGDTHYCAKCRKEHKRHADKKRVKTKRQKAVKNVATYIP